MKMHRRLFSLAAAAVALAVMGSQAQAAYTYSTSIVINSVAGSGGTIVNTPATGATFTSTGGTVVSLQDILTPGTFLTPGSLSANIGNVGVGTTSTAAETFTVNYTDTITITNPTPGGLTGTFTVTGNMILTGVRNTGGATAGTVTNQYVPPFTVGPITITSPTTFTVSFGTGLVNDFFGPPTIVPVSNPTTSGSLGAVINSAVPEPTSMALIGIGLTGLIGYNWRRREVARRLLAD